MLVYLRDGSAQTILRAATQIKVADQTFHLTQSQYTDAGPTSPRADPIPPAPGRVATGVPIFKSLGSSALEADVVTTGQTRRSLCTDQQPKGFV